MNRKKPTDPTAAARQQRRRDVLKEQNAKAIRVVLSADHLTKMVRLMESGYGATQGEVLAKALEAVSDG